MLNPPETATPRLRHAVELAQQRADKDGRAVQPEDLMLGMLDEGTGVATLVLTRLGADRVGLRDALLAGLVTGATPPGDDPTADAVARRAIERAVAEANQLGHHYLGQEHLLLALLREPERPVGRVLARFGVTDERAVAEFTALFSQPQ